MSVKTEIEECILKSFFSGYSVEKVISDFHKNHNEYTPEGAKKLVLKVLCEHVSSY